VQVRGRFREGGVPARRGIRSVDMLTVVPADRFPSHPELHMQIATGMCCALAGHVVAGGPWLYTVAMSTVYDPPDSVFMVAGLTAILQLVLFVVSFAVGAALLRSGRRHVGIGLLTGWFVGGVVVLGGGTAILGFLAAGI
jgi:hypothetical protein